MFSCRCRNKVALELNMPVYIGARYRPVPERRRGGEARWCSDSQHIMPRHTFCYRLGKSAMEFNPVCNRFYKGVKSTPPLAICTRCGWRISLILLVNPSVQNCGDSSNTKSSPSSTERIILWLGLDARAECYRSVIKRGPDKDITDFRTYTATNGLIDWFFAVDGARVNNPKPNAPR